MKNSERETYFTRIRPSIGARHLASGVLGGFAALFSIADPGSRHPVSQRTTANQALRGDMVRIGGDLRRVIEREKAWRRGPEDLE
jgi:hypothetical protein